MDTIIFSGDEEFNINCTGDACVGDEVRFSRAVFSGSFRKPKFCGYEIVTGKIIADSYGAAKQQHTFTIALECGQKTLIKGRNLYKNGVFRRAWADERARDAVLDEKHSRGEIARKISTARKQRFFFQNEV